MTYGYENLKLEKGMYAQSGKSFSRVLESLDPSENYRGTALEGLDAFQRQLKRFDIKVKGAGSDRVEKFFWSTESAVLFPEFVSRVVRQGMVEKFFHTTDSAVLFPEFVSRVVRQGMESDILPEITATTTNFDGMDYRTIASVPTDDDKALRRVEEGAVLPTTAIRTQENLVKLHKRGRMLVASYEAIRFQRLDLFSVTLRQIGAYIARMHLDDAVQVLMNGDGNNNAADAYEIGSGSGKISGTAGTLTYSALLEFWSKFDPYSMNTMLVSNDVMLQMLKLSEFQNPLTGLNFPAYIGAMLVAVVVRNVMDGVHVSYPAEEIDTMGNMFLSIFLAMALAGLKLWELIDLAMPMVICLVLQCVVMFLFSYFVVFNVMGRNYDAAVMTAGFIGFAMGATSNAMANMQVVTKKYSPSPVAYFAIPMVGGMFIDFFNAVLIAANIGWWT